MKLQFDANQDYQLEAIQAVVSLFEGQPDASQISVGWDDELSSLKLTETGVANRLFLLAINLTKRCNLACAHCYMDAETMKHSDKNELTTEEARGLLDDIAGRSTETMVVLTGGEPMMRGESMSGINTFIYERVLDQLVACRPHQKLPIKNNAACKDRRVIPASFLVPCEAG